MPDRRRGGSAAPQVRVRAACRGVVVVITYLGRTHDKQMFFVRGIDRAGPPPWTSHSARLGDSRRRARVAGIPPIPPVADIRILIDVMHGAVDERVCFMKQVREAPD